MVKVLYPASGSGSGALVKRQRGPAGQLGNLTFWILRVALGLR